MRSDHAAEPDLGVAEVDRDGHAGGVEADVRQVVRLRPPDQCDAAHGAGWARMHNPRTRLAADVKVILTPPCIFP